MKAGDDDEALRWEGDADSATPPATKTPEAKPSTITEPSAAEAPAAEATKPATSAILLVTYGIIAGAYLIYTIGWATVLVAPRPVTSDILGEIGYWFNIGLAIASPAIWFGAAFLLTRGRKPIVRLLALLLGLVVVLPWPFIIGAL